MENDECLEEGWDLCRGHQPVTLPHSALTPRSPSAPPAGLTDCLPTAVIAVPCGDRCRGLYAAQPPRWHLGTI